jgi:TCP-1/cpn60 chaperonin family
MPDEAGSIDVVEVIEIGGDRVTVFRQEEDVSRTSTIVLRGATQNYLDDLERAIDDGVSVIKAITKDPRLVPGAGATEMELLKRVLAYGDKTPGVLQHAIKKYGEAFEVIPRTLAETSGLDATEVLSRLYTAHHNSDDGLAGVDIEVVGTGKSLIFRARRKACWRLRQRGYWIPCPRSCGRLSWLRTQPSQSSPLTRLSCLNLRAVLNLLPKTRAGTKTSVMK